MRIFKRKVMNKETRKAFVAGKFYPSNPDELKGVIEKIYQAEKDKIKISLANKKIIGGIVPHAGYIFSAYQAVHFFEILRKSQQQFNTVVIVNPSHTGYGEDISLSGHSAWETPFGSIAVDMDFAKDTGLKFASIAHEYEHSGEVMIPLLQYFLDYNFRIVPVSLKKQTPAIARQTAKAIHAAQQKSNKQVLLIASSDFSHYVPPAFGKKQDELVIEQILKFNTDEVYNKVKEHNVSCCGYGPIMTLMEYAELVSEMPEIEILRRGHSGEVYPSDEVVDYVSMLAYKG